MHFKPSALIRGSGGNSQVSLRQFNWREILDEPPVLQEYALGKPKLTVGAIVIFEVFDSCVGRTQVNLQLVVDGLARIFHIHAKVRDVVIIEITAIFNYIGSFDWTSQGYPFRLTTTTISMAADIWFNSILYTFFIIFINKILFNYLYFLIITAFKRDSWKYYSFITHIFKFNLLIVEELHVSDGGFTLYCVNCITILKSKIFFELC